MLIDVSVSTSVSGRCVLKVHLISSAIDSCPDMIAVSDELAADSGVMSRDVACPANVPQSRMMWLIGAQTEGA